MCIWTMWVPAGALVVAPGVSAADSMANCVHHPRQRGCSRVHAPNLPDAIAHSTDSRYDDCRP